VGQFLTLPQTLSVISSPIWIAIFLSLADSGGQVKFLRVRDCNGQRCSIRIAEVGRKWS
jgi:hypothetical protein